MRGLWIAGPAMWGDGLGKDAKVQCLAQTLDMPAEQWRVLQHAHQKRNIAEYDGELDVTQTLLSAMIDVAEHMVRRCEGLGLARNS